MRSLSLSAIPPSAWLREESRGKVEGFSVPHVHVHLVPVNSGNELNPERAVAASPEQLTIIQNKICQVINT